MFKTIKPAIAVAAIAAVGAPAAASGADVPHFTNPRTIDNPYLPISRFHRCVMRGVENGKKKLTIKRLLDRTRVFRIGDHDVRAAMILDRSWEDGRLVEKTYDYYAQADDGTVYYLGEDANYYKNGRVTGHEGSWRFGHETQTLGVAMPSNPAVGDQWALESVGQIASEANSLSQRLATARVRGVRYRDV